MTQFNAILRKEMEGKKVDSTATAQQSIIDR